MKTMKIILNAAKIIAQLVACVQRELIYKIFWFITCKAFTEVLSYFMCKCRFNFTNQFLSLVDEELFNMSGEIVQGLQCCSCNEGFLLQVNFINHLLSHVVLPVKSEEDTMFELETLAEPEELLEQKPERTGKKIKSKPSYHNQYNRRDRSPNTQRVQQEFTYDPGSKMFFCNFCRNGYKHKQTVERHLSKEHYEAIIGGTAEKSTNNSTSVAGQRLSFEGFTMDAEVRMFYCNYCSNGYKHKQTMERHLAKEHNVIVQKNRLSVKPEGPERSIAAETYRKKEKNLICDLCGQRFLFRESLRKHLNRHVASKKRGKIARLAREKIICDQCSKLVVPSLMKRHFQVHHDDYRPFRCGEEGCKTSFFDITKFKDHQNIHLNVKPYICEFCNEAFHYGSNYRQHKLRHTHPDRFKCEICSSCFVSTKSLRLHMRLHTEDPNAPKPFSCDQDGCDKTFRYIDRLKLHIFNVHQPESDHQCNQ